MAIANVINLKNEVDESVTKRVNTFLNRNKADNTQKAYKRDVEEFFGVSVEHITFDMIYKLTSEYCEGYFDSMVKNKTYEKSTINRKVYALKSLFNFIITADITDCNGNKALDFNPLGSYRVKFRNKRYGSFKKEEAIKIIKVAKEEGRKDLSLYYEILCITGVRAEAILELTMDNFEKRDDVWCIVGVDKCDKDFCVPVRDYIYNDCLELLNLNNQTAIFTFAQNTALNKLKGGRKYSTSYCAKIGMTEKEVKNRNLVLHSFKKTSIQTGNKLCNGDATKVIRLAHNTPQYALDTYMEGNEIILKEELSYNLNFRDEECENTESVSNNVSSMEDKINSMSKEELIRMIMSNNGLKDNIQSVM